jgi:hypothetical protein
MVIQIDTAKDTPEEIAEKIRRAQAEQANELAAKKAAAKQSAFGKVKWEEDPLEYQKRMRDEWA